MSETPKSPATTAADWQARYETRDTPWDSGLVDRELVDYLARGARKPHRVIELGCGTGTNALYLAGRGATVTAVDLADNAIQSARRRAGEAKLAVQFVVADVTRLTEVTDPFDFVFDRGCYHCVRRAGALAGYLKTLDRLTAPGTRALILAGNPDSGEPGGPPKVTAAELANDFERQFRIERLAAIRFEDAGHVDGPLGWRLELVRR